MPLSGDFDFIQAKAHGLRSRVYEHERLDDLCDLRTLPQLWHRLYSDAEPGDHHDLQRRLLADHVATLDLIRQHLPERLAPLGGWMMRRYQVENLKVLLRAWKAREPLASIRPFLAPLPADLALDPEPFLKVSHVGDFILLVPEDGLRAIARKGAPQYALSDDTFFIEAALDAGYYAGLLEQQARLPAAHRHGTEGLIRLEVAAYNLLSVFRFKLSYALPYEKVLPFLLPGIPHAVHLERLYDFPDFRDMLRFIPRTILRAEALAEVFTIADLERALWERLLYVANRRFYLSVSDLGGVVALYAIKRVELANLIHVIEGVRYGMAPDAIRRGLIRLPEPALRPV
jgi:V/A-type H+-transporting ATPase subunit C